MTQDIDEVDDEDQDQHVDSAIAMEEDEESAPTETGDGPTGDGEASILMLICLIRWLVAYFCWTVKCQCL